MLGRLGNVVEGRIVEISAGWLGSAGIALCILGYLPQVVHLVKERCSAGLSVGAYVTWGIAAVLLLSYAFVRRDPVFVVLQAYHVVATALICYYCVKYKGRFCEVHGGETYAQYLAKRGDG
jgi:uncharacterized protein with PQ loop repeat